jgi:hypothetical protein
MNIIFCFESVWIIRRKYKLVLGNAHAGQGFQLTTVGHLSAARSIMIKSKYKQLSFCAPLAKYVWKEIKLVIRWIEISNFLSNISRQSIRASFSQLKYEVCPENHISYSNASILCPTLTYILLFRFLILSFTMSGYLF